MIHYLTWKIKIFGLNAIMQTVLTEVQPVDLSSYWLRS